LATFHHNSSAYWSDAEGNTTTSSTVAPTTAIDKSKTLIGPGLK